MPALHEREVGQMYEERPPEMEPGGCREALALTRAAFGVLFWPLTALLGTLAFLGVTVYLFFTSPLLALIPIALAILAAIAFARWENRRFRPPGL